MAAVVYGVTAQGFLRKPQTVIQAEIEADELAEMDANLDISTASIVGQLNGIFARQLGINWEALEGAYNGFDPDAAEGRLLEMLSKLTGTLRKGSTQSTVVVACDLDLGTTIVSGTHFAAVEDHADVRFTPLADFTSPADGAHSITFVSELFGPIEAFAGTLNIIATPVVGWNSVVNPNDAELGLEIDSDPALRLRRQQEIAALGSTTVRAVTAKISQAFSSKLQSLTVFENDTDAVDARGLPPHSLEALIFDGVVPLITNTDLAQVLFDAKAGGIQTFGEVATTANALVNGIETTKPVYFTRADQTPIYVTLHVTRTKGYIGDGAVADAVAETANTRFSPGGDVIESVISGIAINLPGVFDVTAVFLGFAPGPTTATNLPISYRQLARFDSTRIVVVSVPLV